MKIEDLWMSLRSVIIKMDRSTQSLDPEALEGRLSAESKKKQTLSVLCGLCGE